MLEAMQYKDNAFVTLTYSDEHLPSDWSVNPVEMQLWQKRLRSACDRRLRFYTVGEYGDLSGRPHYHAAVFNFPTCRYGRTRQNDCYCCVACHVVRQSWTFGSVEVAMLEEKSAAYVAGYVTKKMTGKDDPRLKGRHPEFCRMSNRPGIGASAMHEVASELLRYDLEKTEDDVPSGLRHGGKILPLGRYLRKKLRSYCGLPENAPQAVLDKIADELLPMYEIALDTPRPKGQRVNVFKSLLVDQEAARVVQMEARQRIFKERKSL